MISNDNFSFSSRPASETEVSKIARKLLVTAGAVGILPTPADQLIAAARIGDLIYFQEPMEGFWTHLTKEGKDIFRGVIQKIRGIADLRHRAIYVHNYDRPSRTLFVKFHELGHQMLQWHNVDPMYVDDDASLNHDVQMEFEREANFFSSELIFQGNEFRKKALDYAPSFEAIFRLAQQHGASRQATIWRYVEEHDENLSVAQYYPTKILDQCGNPELALWRIIASSGFLQKFFNINVPCQIRTGHPWIVARDSHVICEGTDNLYCGEKETSFEWHSWWNGYTLFVLIRRRPLLGIVGRIIK